MNPNPNQPSRDEIEARITALLLGELPADEAQLLRWTISQDPALLKLQEELAQTIVLVREAAKTPASASGENEIPLKLADERRDQLLAHFKTARPQAKPPPKDPLFWLKRIDLSRIQAPRLLTVLAVLAIVAVLAAMMLPSLASAKKKAQKISLANLEKQRALEEQMRVEDEKTVAGQPVAAATPTALHEVVTVAPEPVLAPPPAPIFLPSTADTTEHEMIASDQRQNFGAFQGGVAGDGSTTRGTYGDAAPAEPAQQANSLAYELTTPAASSDALSDKPADFDGKLQDRFYRNNIGGGSGGGGGAVAIGQSEPIREAQRLPGVSTAAAESADATRRTIEAERNKELGRASGGTTAGNLFAVNGVVANGDALSAQTTFAKRLDESPKKEAGEFNFAVTAPASPATEMPAAAPGSTSLAWFASDANRSRVENGPANLGEEFRYQIPSADAAAPTEKLPDVALNSVVGESSAAFKLKTENSDQLVTGGLRPSLRLTPVITDRTAVDFQQGASATTGGRDTAVNDLDQNQAGALVGDKAPALGDQPVAGKLFQSRSTTIAGSGALTFEGAMIETATNSMASPDKFYSGLTKDDVGGVRNAVIDPATGLPIAPNHLDTSLDNNGVAANAGLASSGSDGSRYITTANPASSVSAVARNYLVTNLGVDLQNPPGKSVFYNDRAGKLFVKATARDLAAIEMALNTNAVLSADDERSKLAEADTNKLFSRAFVLPDVTALLNAPAKKTDEPLPQPAPSAPIPQPEILTRENNFSTFSLNVSDVSFKLAAASLERGQMPEAASIRSEEFINAFDYRDPEAAAGQPLAFVSERARYPFAQNRDLLRFSVKTAAAGRAAGRPLNLVLLLDNSGSMERADRVAIIREALRVLATQLQPQDTVSVVTFARTARLWADGVHGDQAGETLARVGGITPEGGTNLEEAMKLAYETARRHYLANGMNRVVLLTDGAANLGDVNPADLKQKVEAQRQQGIALDCFGIGSHDFNDDLLEQLSRNGDGRYAFLNSTDDASKDFAAKLAGALRVAASDVKVQVEFNPQRVISYRQIGYAKHQLTKEQFRDNTVDAAEIAAQEAGNALYTVETKADGIGPVATVRVRYKVPGTTDYRERSWDVPYEGGAAALAQSSAAMRLAATASAFSEWLVASPFAQEVTPDELLKALSGVPQVYGADQRPQKLEWMIRQAKSVAGK